MATISQTSEIRNPFPVYKDGVRVGWQWYDEAWQVHDKMYPSQTEAVIGLLKYMRDLESGPSRWSRVKSLFRKLWDDER